MNFSEADGQTFVTSEERLSSPAHVLRAKLT